MHVRMMRLVVKRSVPLEIFKRNVMRLSDVRNFRAYHVSPSVCVVESKPLSVVTRHRDDHSKDITVERRNIFRRFREINLSASLRKQTMCAADSLSSRTSRHVVEICFLDRLLDAFASSDVCQHSANVIARLRTVISALDDDTRHQSIASS